MPMGGAADLTTNAIIEISGPNNPRIDTNNNIHVVFGVKAVGGWPLAGGRGGKPII